MLLVVYFQGVSHTCPLKGPFPLADLGTHLTPGRCSYRVRGADGSCAKHLTVEFYTVVMLPTVILIITNTPSRTHSFILGVKPSFSANLPTAAFPLLLQD